MGICDYAIGDAVTMESVFKACEASFNYVDEDVTESDIVQMLRNIGYDCVSGDVPNTYPGSELAVVDYVIDGDTMSVFLCPDNTCTLAPLTADRIRLWHTSVNEVDYPTGAEAKGWVKDRIKEGDIISFDRKGEDPYGRILAIVYSESGTNINTGLIESGYGRPWTAEESALYETEIPTVPPSEPASKVIQFVGNVQMPDTIALGSENWIGADYANVGTVSGKWWLGIRLQDENGVDWRYTGDSTYASRIDAGETKTLWVRFTPPTTLSGSLRTFLIINQVEQ
ncbi:MAG: thermonuclease family protein [Parcubacteria group bacterium]|jgi:endonuclease YncB( thermonuclease family)